MTPAELSARGVRVKPLFWWTGQVNCQASSECYSYSIRPIDGSWRLAINGNIDRRKFKSPELAKAVAQAHHDARVADQLELMEVTK